MALLAALCNLNARFLTVLRRRLRISRVSWPQLIVILFIMALIIWKTHHVTDNYKLTMGKEGPAFVNIVDEYTWAVGDNGKFTIQNHGENVLVTHLGSIYSASGAPCDGIDQEQHKCVQFGKYAKSTVSSYSDGDAQCFDVHSTSLDQGLHNPIDCFELQSDDFGVKTHWYGGVETYNDRWPIELNIKERAHVSDHGGYGSVLERYWFSSRGVGIFVEDAVPLFVKADEKTLCLIGKYDNNIYQNINAKKSYLKYTICAKGNLLDTHKFMSNRFIRKPIGIPDEKMIKYPVWSTWAKYKSGIDQATTIKFTNEIADHGFPVSQIEIDDRYTINYGDYIFDAAKFPDPKQMLEHIHRKGFRATIWTHPFSNFDTQSYKEGKRLGYWVQEETGTQAGQANWWRGSGGALDVTNPDAVTWFKNRLKEIRTLGVDGHKFDAGEIGFLPKRFKTKRQLTNPCHYSSLYAEAMHNITGPMQMRVGYKTQHLPIFLSIMDRASDWGYGMGLRSLISTSLVFSSIGYFFIMPDMIGGNAYCRGNMDCTDVKPERELFIRWIQLTAFLPMMQFSFTPWQYDDQVVQIAKKYTTLHADYVAPRIIALGRAAVTTGNPIIRPMWWAAPDDHVSYDLDSQFLIGDDLIVAPILDKGASGRRVYLPRGIWKDMINGREYTVDKDNYFFTFYQVKIDEIPYFERVLIP